MTEQFDVSTLNWVKAEIDETLQQARVALEKFVENPEDETQIHFCATYLHQVRGTLQMVELSGGYLLAEEMERLADNLPEAGVERERAFDILMRTILLLPDYLESLQSGLPDSPIILLPLINDLRRARGEKELSQAAAFRPDLSVMPPPSFTGPRIAADLKQVAARLRPYYQAALLKILRGDELAGSLKTIAAVFSKLAGAEMPDRLRRWVWVSSAFVEALRTGGSNIDGPSKQLLGKNEQLIKFLASHGPAELNEEALTALLRGLLYEVGKAASGGKRVKEVKEGFNLEALLPSPEVAERLRSNLGGFNAELKKTVSRDVMEELARIQDVLDLFGRSKARSAEELQPVAEGMERVNDILELLRQDALRSTMREQLANVRRFIDTNSAPDEQGLMDIASAIVSVESALRDWGVVNPVEKADEEHGQVSAREEAPEAEAEHQRVIRQVMKEAKDELVRARETVSSYLHEGQDKDSLSLAVQQLRQIAGSLSMLSYKRAALIMEACRRFVANDLIKGENGPPEPEMLDSLADAMMSLEYYLEAFVESRVHPSSMLDVAERAVANLRYPVDKVTLEPPETIEIQAPPEEPDDVELLTAADDALTTSEPTGTDTPPLPGEPPEASGQAGNSGGPQEAKKDEAPVAQSPHRNSDVDDEIVEIFGEEADEELQRIAELLPQWKANPGEAGPLQEIRRAFHTLKGSGRLVGAAELGEFAWAFENMLNRVMDRSIEPGPVMFDLLGHAHGALTELLAEFMGKGTPSRDTAALEAAAWALSKGQVPDIPGKEDVAAQAGGAESGTASGEPPVETAGTVLELDPTLREIYSKEAEAHIGTISRFLVECVPPGCRVNDDLIRALHTLTGSSRAAGVQQVAEITAQLEKAAKLLQPTRLRLSQSVLGVLAATAAFVTKVVAHLNDNSHPLPDSEDLEQRARTVLAEAKRSSDQAGTYVQHGQWGDASREAESELEPDELTEPSPSAVPGFEAGADGEELGQGENPRLATTRDAGSVEQTEGKGDNVGDAHEGDNHATSATGDFVVEAGKILQRVEGPLQSWYANSDDYTPLELLQRQFHALATIGAQAEVFEISSLAEVLAFSFSAIAEGRAPATDDLLKATQDAHDYLDTQLGHFREGEQLASSQILSARLKAALEEQPARPSPADRTPDRDPELLEIFLEEAEELLDSSDETLQAWSQDPDDRSLMEKLQRDLHTLKGGARMAGVPEIGDLGHSVESMMAGLADGILKPSAPMFNIVQRVQDRLAVMVEQLRNDQPVTSGDDLTQAVERVMAGTPPTEESETQQEEAAEPVVPEELPAVAEPDAPVVERPDRVDRAEGTGQAPERRQRERQQHDMIRVRAELLDSLVNVAGESSIFRSRVEQQIGSFHSNLDELEQTLERFRDQLRTMDIQTEAQIQSRYEEAAAQGYEDFDPLEFDRFTHMQQLSRSMMESLSDLANLEGTLGQVLRETETLLLQQGRVNTELQEGLMQTRMVPLVQNAPRLRRIVRQTCAELGRRAELRFQGAEVEMDRNLVERIMAPLEHLLRNAVAHGIEGPDKRRSAGKPEAGTIVVAQAREGAEVVVRVSDDGGGINVEAVRKKAIARGLLDENARLSDNEILPFILESGFSTAESLSQIAGRGVGMDVVNSEIKGLNGSLSIESEPGKGTTFTIRLPVTLTVSRALMVYVGEDIYAVPLLGITGVVRASREELEELFSRERPYYRWLEQDFDLMHLGTVLGVSSFANAGPEAQRPALLLIQSAEHQVALAVDGLLGSREVVVKSVGRQLGNLRGLSGATILGDGQVALILELPAVVRLGLSKRGGMHVNLQNAGNSSQRAVPLVMVVDDSITVRKVSTRLLERNAMQAVAAKDGVEALTMLEETRPDVILLDIEMPRMDGYELATHIRNTPELRDIPIIMITSRSGEKHRERAMQIGVNEYMSKPFQEADLLEKIRTFIDGDKKDAAASNH